MLIGPLGINFSGMSVEIEIFSINKMLRKPSTTCQPLCLGLNVLKSNVKGPNTLHRQYRYASQYSGRELWRGQAQMGWIFIFKFNLTVKFKVSATNQVGS